MIDLEKINASYVVNEKLLVKYGFILEETDYVLSRNIVDDQFQLTVSVMDGLVKTKLTDISSGEPYTLHNNKNASGDFIGRVRYEYTEIMDEIVEACFTYETYHGTITKQVIEYVLQTYGDEPLFLWEKSKTNSVLRLNGEGKWYGALLVVPYQKLGLDRDGNVEILNVKVESEEIDELLEIEGVVPAYHMNKKHWVSLLLDGSLSMNSIKAFIDQSYASIKTK